jgi:ankyrin repeat domain-containing protein 50
VVDNLRSKFLAQDTIGILNIFFRYDNEEKQTVMEIMGSILQQLVQRRGAIDSDIKAKYDYCTRRGIKPTTTEYVDLVKKQMENLEKVFLIVDALDECPENKRRDFLHVLGGLPPSINVFLTSRDDIHPQMGGRKMQKLVIRATEDDVKTYVRSRLEEERDSPRLGNHLLEQPSLGEDIIRNIVQKADGMHVFYS